MRNSVYGMLVLSGMLLGACSKNVTVSAPIISPTDFASQNKTAGNYAVMVQSGAWHTEVKAAGWTCSAWSFPTDFETAYNQSIKAGMQQNFEKVTFVGAPLTPEEMRAQNFDAQIVVYEGSILANFSVSPNFWTATINANVNMDGIVAVIDQMGKVQQGNARGSGTGSATTAAGCTPAGKAIVDAGGVAIRDYVLNAVNSVKLNILEIKANKVASDGKPTS
jgi:hypothetical protein